MGSTGLGAFVPSYRDALPCRRRYSNSFTREGGLQDVYQTEAMRGTRSADRPMVITYGSGSSGGAHGDVPDDVSQLDRVERALARHGAPAEWAVSPWKRLERKGVPSGRPTNPRSLLTCVNNATSDVLEEPSRTNSLAASSYPPCPARSGWARQILAFHDLFTAIAAVTSRLAGSCGLACRGPLDQRIVYATTALHECGIPSMSEPSAITGFPDPHVAMNAVGMPAMPSSTANPFFFRMSTR